MKSNHYRLDQETLCENDAEEYGPRKAYYTHEGLRNTTRGAQPTYEREAKVWAIPSKPATCGGDDKCSVVALAFAVC